MNYQSTWIRLSLFALIGLCLMPNQSWAAGQIKAITGQLNLSATVSGEPAFQPVTWRLKPKHATTATDVTIDNRHSAVVDLEAGTYQVTATMGDMVKIEQIVIKEGGKHKLVVNLK